MRLIPKLISECTPNSNFSANHKDSENDQDNENPPDNKNEGPGASFASFEHISHLVCRF